MKKVLVTGASTGIGKSAALRLARQGWKVYAGVRSSAAGDELRREGGENLHPITLDVTDSSQVAEAERLLSSESEGLDGLVNNAGIVVAGPFECVPMKEWRKQFDVNVFGLIEVTQRFLPALRKKKGRIVNVSSVNGFLASPFVAPYAASKFAVEGLSDALRREVLNQGVSVSLIEPGPIATPIWEKSKNHATEILKDLSPEMKALYEKVLRKVDRYVEKSVKGALPPEKVAEAILHALESPRPRIRYVIGRQMQLATLAIKLMPTSWMDRGITKQLG
jgi:NAD(P)-dependent dehydrogenase (short-subunit alcohol dehydrogenase family)